MHINICHFCTIFVYIHVQHFSMACATLLSLSCAPTFENNNRLFEPASLVFQDSVAVLRPHCIISCDATLPFRAAVSRFTMLHHPGDGHTMKAEAKLLAACLGKPKRMQQEGQETNRMRN